MSEEQKLDEEVKVDESALKVEEAKADDTLPKTVEFGGKTFDVSSEGLKQLAEYGKTTTSLIGKLGNEVGKLRKFEPSASEDELFTKIAQLRDEGAHVEADRLIVSYTKQKEADILQKVSVEKQNELTWKEYFKSRPELTELFDEDVIKTVSETKLNVYDSDNIFKSLDDYWLPKVKKLVPKTDSAKKPVQEKPPVTLSGGTARQTTAKATTEKEAPKTESFLDILRSRSIYTRR